MQLETTIEQRRREIGNVSNDINNERDQNENMKNNVKRDQLDLLSKKLEKHKNNFLSNKFATLSQRYDEVSTSK